VGYECLSVMTPKGSRNVLRRGGNSDVASLVDKVSAVTVWHGLWQN